MKPRTLRRKLQKKLKHKPYRKCPLCGKRSFVDVKSVGDTFELWQSCQCGFKKQLFWSCGGKADTYSTSAERHGKPRKA
jgi:hypothetical protein